MKKVKLGATGLSVTPIGFGVLNIGKTHLNYPISEGAALIRYALDRGVNFLDTAQYYETYPYIKEAIIGAAPDPVISSKCLSGSSGEMKIAIEEARRETGRDVIDIFLLHEVRGASDWASRAGAWGRLREAKNKGLVKAIGVSTHHVDVAKMCADIPDIDVIFPLINFKSLGIRDKTNPGSKEDMAAAIELCSNNGKGVFAMKVLGGGNLIGEYIQALDYVSGLPGIASMMIGFGSRDEIDRAIEYAEGAIDRNYAPGTSGRRIRIIEGDCVGCGACAERCPSIAISRSTPGLFEINHSLCVACGYCAPVCPVNAIITL